MVLDHQYLSLVKSIFGPVQPMWVFVLFVIYPTEQDLIEFH